MKKIISLFLILALCAGLCACGGSKAADTPSPAPSEAAKTLDKPAIDKPAKPVETDAPKKVEIEVSDLCSLSGRCFDGYGWTATYSYCLPEIEGPDTAYLKQVRTEIDGIYDEYVAPQLTSMKDGDGFLYDTCGYRYAVNDGIHSISICVTTDWGEDYYWCYNFDADGNEVANEQLLKAAGSTADRFVSSLKDFLTEYTDYSDFMTPEELKLCQESIVEPTLAEDNCNAQIPMYLNADGNLCCIQRIFSIAGAASYLHELEMHKDGTFTECLQNGAFLTRLTGGYTFPAPDDEGTEYFFQIFTVGDNLVLETSYLDKESGDVYSFAAAEMIPENRTDLYRTDIDSMRFTFNVYSVSSFGGAYCGESAVYTVTLTDDGIRLTDFAGMCPLLGGGEDLEGTFDWREDDYAYQYFDWNSVDYDLMEEAGVSGIWSGYYSDADYGTHSVTMELTGFGSMLIRDVCDNCIPRVLKGYYRVVGAEDGPFPEGAITFTLTRVGDYKMPLFGCCGMEIDDEGTLLVYNLEDSVDFDYLFDTYDEQNAVFERVPMASQVREKQIIAIGEDPVSIDIDLDGTEETVGFFYEEDDNGCIDTLCVTLGDTEYYAETWMYDADAWLFVPDCSGICYVLVDGLSDNDHHFLTAFRVLPDNVTYAGEWFGGLDEDPTDPDCFSIWETVQLLSTAGVSRSYAIGTSGLPEPIDPYFYVTGAPDLTLKQDLEVWEANPETGELLDFATLEAGTVLELYRTDGESMYDLKTEDGRCFRVWPYFGYQSEEIDGISIYELFDGILFAG